MAFRARNLAALRRTHQPADVVNLQPEQVPDAVRQEHARHARLDGFVGVALDDVGVVQQLGNEPVRGQMDVAPIHSRMHARAERLLHVVHARDQRGEVAVFK
jgi:hypothetical protein